MNSQLIIYKIETLLGKSPSVLRIGTAIWPLRIISVILAPIFIISGISIVILTVWLLSELGKDPQYNMNKINSLIIIAFVGGVGITIAGILLIFIAWLCRLVRNRNEFIVETKTTLTSIKNDLAQTDKNA